MLLAGCKIYKTFFLLTTQEISSSCRINRRKVTHLLNVVSHSCCGLQVPRAAGTGHQQDASEEDGMTHALEAWINATDGCKAWHEQVSGQVAARLQSHKDALTRSDTETARHPVAPQLDTVRQWQ